ncbi:MAG: adenosylmethionine--8-amino-7-oxononanoate transaminase [Balneolaceae bacterium]|nr:adenosylmethionine--8-amino-7-oxononanoate transaminase [Balneolaceae bacterium]
MHPNIWYPFTIIEDAPEPLKVVKGEGIWLELEDGRRIMDCISSWWVNLHGHAHPDIAAAISEQANRLEQVIFANFSHEPAEQLAESLAAKLPGNLNRVFFSDDGSTAVEVAMKIAYQYWTNTGERRKTFICFEGAYHGDTFGAMSAGDRSVFTEVFKELLFDVEFLSYPETWIDDHTAADRENDIIETLEAKLTEYPARYAGVLIEPLVQGAGGMRMCRPEFIQKLRETCNRYGTLLIFDEVMTGFGRTGSFFASERAGVAPDIICLAKGITGGFLPLAVTVCSDEIYDIFRSSDPLKTFWHGHSYTANPLGCAAALASLKLMDEHRPVYSQMENWHREAMQELADVSDLNRLRVTGTIAAMDLVTGEGGGYLDEVALQIKKKCIEKGLLLRPLGNVLYLMPPYCVTPAKLQEIYRGIKALLSELT